MKTTALQRTNSPGRWRVTVWLAVVAGLLIAAELLLRFAVGLGDPPLTLRDPEIDYIFAPSRCYDRFHHRVCYNQWSMRSDEFPRRKEGCERRVLVLGDSIPNGGAYLDQSQIGTEVARTLLAQRGLPTTVGNVSAGSWGPANLTAYVARHGWFESDVVVFVFNLEDIDDLPEFSSDLGPEYPLRTPNLALAELLTRYVPRYLPSFAAAPPNPTPPVAPSAAERRERGLLALQRLLEDARQHVPERVVLLHSDLAHLETVTPEASLFQQASEQSGARFIDLRSRERAELFEDHIHLNAAGQAMLGRVLADTVAPLLKACPAAP